MNRRVLFSLPAPPLAGSFLAYGPQHWSAGPAAASPQLSRIAPEAWIKSGTPLRVRLGQNLDTGHNRAGHRFEAVLEAPVVDHGQVAIPSGVRFQGRVAGVRPGGRLQGRAHLAVRLDSFELYGRHYAVDSLTLHTEGESQGRRSSQWAACGLSVGAIIGGIAGGVAGLLIGAAAGALAAGVSALAAGKIPAHIPARTLLTFVLSAPVWA